MERGLFTYTGKFQWWSYTVSHGQLLLRSPKSAERLTQVDVLFKDVAIVHLPTWIDRLEVLEGDSPQTLDLQGRKYFVVRGRSSDGYVVAGAVFHDEGDHDYQEPSPLVPAFPP